MMSTILLVILGVGALVAIGVRAAQAKRRAIDELEDAEPFVDNDPRLEGVKTPEEE